MNACSENKTQEKTSFYDATTERTIVMTKFKKIFAGALAAVSVMSSALCVGASAREYSDVGSWQLYSNPNVSHSSTDMNLAFFSNGYRAFISSKGNGGATNYVTISQKGTYKATLTEVNVISGTFKSNTNYADRDGDMYAPFTVKMTVGDTSSATAYNNGTIKIKSLF